MSFYVSFSCKASSHVTYNIVLKVTWQPVVVRLNGNTTVATVS